MDILNLVIEKFSEDVNFVESSTGITAMHIACLYGHSKCVQRLIEFQAKVDEQVSRGYFQPTFRLTFICHFYFYSGSFR